MDTLQPQLPGLAAADADNLHKQAQRAAHEQLKAAVLNFLRVMTPDDLARPYSMQFDMATDFIQCTLTALQPPERKAKKTIIHKP